MPKILPFRALRPINSSKYAQFTSLLQDEDVLSVNFNKDSISEYNFIKLIFPGLFKGLEKIDWQDKNLVKEATNLFVSKEILSKESLPSLYIYQQIVHNSHFIGILGLVPTQYYKSNQIKKHELTRVEKEKQIAEYFSGLKMNGNPVLLTYPSNENDALEQYLQTKISTAPDVNFITTNGAQHQLWQVTDIEECSTITELSNAITNFYIADGHHRCASYGHILDTDAILSYIVPSDFLKIAPFHRAITKGVLENPSSLIQTLERDGFKIEKLSEIIFPSKQQDIHILINHECYKISFTKHHFTNDDVNHPDNLDVSLLEKYILKPHLKIDDTRKDKRISFLPGVYNIDEIKALISNNLYDMIFLVHPLNISQVVSISDADLTLPPKSTWIEPKIPSGILIQLFE